MRVSVTVVILVRSDAIHCSRDEGENRLNQIENVDGDQQKQHFPKIRVRVGVMSGRSVTDGS